MWCYVGRIDKRCFNCITIYKLSLISISLTANISPTSEGADTWHSSMGITTVICQGIVSSARFKLNLLVLRINIDILWK